ncbi:hypothetical protein [Actinomadura rugatobispora]|uniref:Zinc ribbon domain-containing protein n=1 Tax=Actinomadura rugatobispora TaxID=1994 RepID=A0ABW1A758_9ACTN|nr:hypothetical protein GCM10010200_018120 [Actinomadura rugatobispora]
MRCRYCGNLDLSPLPFCTHCGEEQPPAEAPRTPGTAWEVPRHQRPRDPAAERWMSIGLSALVLVVLIGGGVITFRHWPTRDPGRVAAVSPSGPAGSDAPAAQVGAMATLLRSISASSGDLPGTLGSCSSVESDIGPLRRLIEERTGHLQQARNLRTDAVPDGDSVKQALVSMLQVTLDTDQKYLTWAERPLCTSAYGDAAITEANNAATRSKQTFVGLWNGLATEYGRQTYTWDDL